MADRRARAVRAGRRVLRAGRQLPPLGAALVRTGVQKALGQRVRNEVSTALQRQLRAAGRAEPPQRRLVHNPVHARLAQGMPVDALIDGRLHQLAAHPASKQLLQRGGLLLSSLLLLLARLPLPAGPATATASANALCLRHATGPKLEPNRFKKHPEAPAVPTPHNLQPPLGLQSVVPLERLGRGKSLLCASGGAF